MAADDRPTRQVRGSVQYGGSEFVNTKDALHRSGTISYLTTGYAKDADVDLTGMKTGQLALVVSDDGDGYDSDHADWIDPVVTLADGSTIKLTDRKYLRGTCGWAASGQPEPRRQFPVHQRPKV